MEESVSLYIKKPSPLPENPASVLRPGHEVIPQTCKPTNIVLTLITGGIRATFTPIDSTETEIWANLNGGSYSLVGTAGIGVGTYDYMVTSGTIGIELRSKTDATVLNVPTTLAASTITGGLRITFLDNNTEADHIEIWSNVNSAGSTLIAAILAGVQTYDYAVIGDTVDLKIRAKEGTLPVYSAFTSVVSKTIVYDVDAAALFVKMTAVGETPDAARKVILNTAFVFGKTKSVWAKIDDVLHLSAHGAESSLLKWKAGSPDAVRVGSPTFVANKGWSGTNGTVGIDTKYNASINGVNYTLNAGGFAMFNKSAASSAEVYISNVSGNSYFQYFTDGKFYTQINSTAYAGFTPSYQPVNKLVVGVRTSSSNVNTYIDDVKVSETMNSTSVHNSNFKILTSKQQALVIFGGGWTDQDVADLKEIFVTGLLHSIGADA